MLVTSTREFREKQGQYLGRVAKGEDLVLLSRKFGSFKIIPVVIKSEPRQGWADAFKQYALSGKEELFFHDVFDDEDLSDIPWERK